MKLEIADMRKSFIDIPNHICISVYFQGCSIKCPGCHNPGLHEFKKGRVPLHVAINIVFMATGFIDSVCLMGGEPLDQDIESLIAFIQHLREIGINYVCLYTGYPFEDVPKEVLNNIDAIKYGRYGDTQVYMEKKVKQKEEWEVMHVEI